MFLPAGVQVVVAAGGTGTGQVPAPEVEDGPGATARFVRSPLLPPRQNPGRACPECPNHPSLPSFPLLGP